MERKSLQLNKNKKAYFAGDFHLGKPDKKSSIEREKKIIEWLEIIKVDAQGAFIRLLYINVVADVLDR